VQPPSSTSRSDFPSGSSSCAAVARRKLFAQAFGRLDTIVAYGWGEVEELRSWLGDRGPRVEFVAFGVDVDHFRPDPARRSSTTSCRSAPIPGATSPSSSSSHGAFRI
jgi:hypothetical protein